MVEFSIFGQNFSLDEVSQRLGIEPSKTHIIGERIRDTPLFQKETLWQVSTGYEESWDINDQLNKIISLLQDKVDILVALRNDLHVEFDVCAVVNIVNEEKPAIYLESDAISFLNKINSSIQFDYYIYDN